MCLKYKAQFFHYSSDNTAEIYLHSLLFFSFHAFLRSLFHNFITSLVPRRNS